jgi:uncharacterized protein YcnI
MGYEKRYGPFTAAVLMMFVAVQAADGHVTIFPRESQTGDEQQYTMRVPTERDTPTVRIEAEFPREVSVTEIDSKDGWQVERRVDADGRVVGAVWSGGSIAPGAAEEFGFLARNPSEEATLTWRVVQIHADGSRTEWVGEPGSRGPAPVTVIRRPAP